MNILITNFKAKMTIQYQNPNPNDKKKYDLTERTAKLGENIIEFLKTIKINVLTSPLISQAIRAGTSIGANYMEADSASTRRDFCHKIGLCKKEAKETMHWLRMIARLIPEKHDECLRLTQEAHELALIFSSVFNKTRKF